MLEKLKNNLIRFITILILLCTINMIVPSSSAGIIDRLDTAYSLNSQLEITYDEIAAQDPILPLDMVKMIPVTLNYRVYGLMAEDIIPDFEKEKIYIKLIIAKTPSWCTATISPSYISFYPKLEWSCNNVTLYVKIQENAPANVPPGLIKIQADVDGFAAVKGGIFQSNVTCTPGYLPLLKITFKTENYARVAPGEPTDFIVDVENLGNGLTDVTTKVLTAPEGWTVSVDPNILLNAKNENRETKKTVLISVVPGYSAGYHDTTEIIKVAFTPTYFNNASAKGPEYIVSFLVRSRGLSTPGFETGLVIIALIFFSAALITRRKYKIKQPGRNKNYREGNL